MNIRIVANLAPSEHSIQLYETKAPTLLIYSIRIVRLLTWRTMSASLIDPPSTALVTVPLSTVERLETSDLPHEPPLIQSPTDVEGKLSGEKAKELGGDKALESAQTLLSIGLNSNSSEDAGAKNPNVIQRPLFNENSSAVPV